MLYTGLARKKERLFVRLHSVLFREEATPFFLDYGNREKTVNFEEWEMSKDKYSWRLINPDVFSRGLSVCTLQDRFLWRLPRFAASRDMFKPIAREKNTI